MNNTSKLLADPDAIRIFWGYKLDSVTKEDFLKDLGETFMPGTPAVLAPMGLNGYLPAVLDNQEPSNIPDEVALIVYPSRLLYNEARKDNLLGRIYTFSHKGVFDMVRSRGQWPGTENEHVKHSDFERWAWRVYNKAVDWQIGRSRLVVLNGLNVNVYEILKNSFNKSGLAEHGVDEIIIQATGDVATIWFYSENETNDLDFDLDYIVTNGESRDWDLGGDLNLICDIWSQPHLMRNLNEKVEIKGEKYIQFKFPRELKYYI